MDESPENPPSCGTMAHERSSSTQSEGDAHPAVAAGRALDPAGFEAERANFRATFLDRAETLAR